MAFNINAQVILSGPKNIRAVRSVITKQLSGLSVPLSLDIQKTSKFTKQVKQLQRELAGLNATATTSNKIIKNLCTTLNQCNFQSLGNIAKTSKKVNNALKDTKKVVSDTASEIESFGKDSALAIRRFSAFTFATGAVFGFVRAVQEGIREAIKFERELIKVVQVTQASSAQIAGLQGTIDRLSTGLGLSANKLVEVSRIFAQTGQSINQVKSSLEAVAKASLAPTFGSIEKTTEGVIAALSQFNLSANKSEEILGSLNAVSKRFAVEADDLISVIRRAGGVFAGASVQLGAPEERLRELISIFTAVRSTTRETADTIATGLRTIFTRLQRPQTIEFLEQFGVQLRATADDAKRLGIVEGEFVGVFEAFKQLSGVINNLDTLTVGKIVEELGGIRQVGKLLPALREFAKAEEARKVALEGTSSVSKDAALATKTLAVQIEQTRERFAKLVRDVSQSDTFQNIARVALGTANAFITLADSLRPVLPLLTAVASIKLTNAAFEFAKGFSGGFKKNVAEAKATVSQLGQTPKRTGPGPPAPSQQAQQQQQIAVLNTNNQSLQQNTAVLQQLLKANTDLNVRIGNLHTQSANNTAAIKQLAPLLNKVAVSLSTLSFRSNPKLPKFADGGIVKGPSHAQGGVVAELEGGEMVIPKKFAEGGRIAHLKDNVLGGLFLENGGHNGDISSNLPPNVLPPTKEDVKKMQGAIPIAHLRSSPTEAFSTSIRQGMAEALNTAYTQVADSLSTEETFRGFRITDEQIGESALNNVDFKSIEGHLFEGFIQRISQATLSDPGATFDFPSVNATQIRKMGLFFDTPENFSPRVLEAKRTSDSSSVRSAGNSIVNKIISSIGNRSPIALDRNSFSFSNITLADVLSEKRDKFDKLKRADRAALIAKAKPDIGVTTSSTLDSEKKKAIKATFTNFEKLSEEERDDIINSLELAMGGTVGKVPVRVSTGELQVPPGLADRYDTQLQNLNSGKSISRGILQDLVENGANVIKGPGTGTSDSISANLPAGTFIVNAKDTKRAFGARHGGQITPSGVKGFAGGGKIAGAQNAISTLGTLAIFSGGLEDLSSSLPQLLVTLSVLKDSFKQSSEETEDATKDNTKKTEQNTKALKDMAKTTKGDFGARKQSRGRRASQGAFGNKAPIGKIQGGSTVFFPNTKGNKSRGSFSTRVPARRKGLNFSPAKLGGRSAPAFGAQQIAKGGRGLLAGGKGLVGKAAGAVKGVSGPGALIASTLVGPLLSGISSLVVGSKKSNEGGEGFSKEQGGATTAKTIGTVGGVAGGAATGAGIGSLILPGLGTLIGGVVGAIGGGIKGFFDSGKSQALFEKFDNLAKASEKLIGSFDKLGTTVGGGEDLKGFVASLTELAPTAEKVFDPLQAFLKAGPGGAIALGKIGASAVKGEDLTIAGPGKKFAKEDIENFQASLSKIPFSKDEVNRKSVEAFDKTANLFNNDQLEVVARSTAKTFSELSKELIDAGASTKEVQDQFKLLKDIGLAQITTSIEDVNKATEGLDDDARTLASTAALGFASRFAQTGDAKASKSLTLASIDKSGIKLDDTERDQINKALEIAFNSIDASGLALSSKLILAQQELEALNSSMDAFSAALVQLDGVTNTAVSDFNKNISNIQSRVDKRLSGDQSISATDRINVFENGGIGRSTDELNAGAERVRRSIGGDPKAFSDIGSIVSLSNTLPQALKDTVDQFKGGTKTDVSREAFIKALESRLPELDKSTDIIKDQLRTAVGGLFKGDRKTGDKIGVKGLRSALEENPEINRLLSGSTEAAAAFENVTNNLNSFNTVILESANLQLRSSKLVAETELSLLKKRQSFEDRFAKFRGEDPTTLDRASQTLDNEVQTLLSAGGAGNAKVGGEVLTGVGGGDLFKRLSELEAIKIDLEKSIGERGGDGTTDLAQSSDAETQKLVTELANVSGALDGTQKAIDLLSNDTRELSAIENKLAQIQTARLTGRQRAQVLASQLKDTKNPQERIKKLEEFAAPSIAGAKAAAGIELNFGDISALLGDPKQFQEAFGLDNKQLDQALANTVSGLIKSVSADVIAPNFQGPQAEGLNKFLENVIGKGATTVNSTDEEKDLQGKFDANFDKQEGLIRQSTDRNVAILAEGQLAMRTEIEKTKAKLLEAAEAFAKLRGILPGTTPPPTTPTSATDGPGLFGSSGGLEAIDKFLGPSAANPFALPSGVAPPFPVGPSAANPFSLPAPGLPVNLGPKAADPFSLPAPGLPANLGPRAPDGSGLFGSSGGLQAINKFQSTKQEELGSLVRQQSEDKERLKRTEFGLSKRPNSKVLQQRRDELTTKINSTQDKIGNLQGVVQGLGAAANGLNEPANQLNQAADKLASLPAMKVDLDANVGTIDVVLNGAAMIQQFGEKMQGQIMEAVSAAIRKLSPNPDGTPKQPDLSSR